MTRSAVRDVYRELSKSINLSLSCQPFRFSLRFTEEAQDQLIHAAQKYQNTVTAITPQSTQLLQSIEGSIKPGRSKGKTLTESYKTVLGRIRPAKTKGSDTAINAWTALRRPSLFTTRAEVRSLFPYCLFRVAHHPVTCKLSLLTRFRLYNQSLQLPKNSNDPQFTQI
ncbi:hypothetical protein [Granulicella tundricola]|nr:hypothetical protein [Granulicella tundricola]